jgi:hypothetical protein
MKTPTMKIYLALILSCASVMGADTGIQVLSTTNYPGSSHSVVVKTDVFTRDGQTNLVCNTTIKDGKLVLRDQTFYHAGLRIGDSHTSSDMQANVTAAGSPYSLSFMTRLSDGASFAYVRAKDGRYLDVFTCTNGVYYPAESRLIAGFNDSQTQAVAQAGSLSK